MQHLGGAIITRFNENILIRIHATTGHRNLPSSWRRNRRGGGLRRIPLRGRGVAPPFFRRCSAVSDDRIHSSRWVGSFQGKPGKIEMFVRKHHPFAARPRLSVSSMFQCVSPPGRDIGEIRECRGLDSGEDLHPLPRASFQSAFEHKSLLLLTCLVSPGYHLAHKRSPMRNITKVFTSCKNHHLPEAEKENGKSKSQQNVNDHRSSRYLFQVFRDTRE